MIKLIKGYKYNNDYDYIKTFSDKTSQNNYFNSLDKILIDDTNYVKEHINSFKVPYDYDFLVSEGINYIIFNNGYKDIFAFVISKEWVSEEVTRIIYDIDVIQTYMFDFTIENSFVERKVCNISEITDFDEGLDLGEHIISGEVLTLQKESVYFAMFNGIKEQKLIFDSNNNISSVVSVPSPTMKPTTMIDDIQYPIYFMQLFEEGLYPEPIFETITIPSGSIGSNQGNIGDKISSQGFRFMKGFEAYAPWSYQDTGGYWTIGYGVTLHGRPNEYNDLLNRQPVSEEYAAQVSYRIINENYLTPILTKVKSMGCTKQYQLDALTDLSYNCGSGAITGNKSDTLALMGAISENPLDETTIRPLWENFRTNGGLAGLVARRKEECNMFFNKPFEVRTIPKINQSGDISGTVTENNGNGWLPS